MISASDAAQLQHPRPPTTTSTPFPPLTIRTLLHPILSSTIGNSQYHYSKVSDWHARITEQCLHKLTGWVEEGRLEGGDGDGEGGGGRGAGGGVEGGVREEEEEEEEGGGKGVKFIVTCLIMQKAGTGLHATHACYWDSRTDGSVTITYENTSMDVIVQVHGLAA